MTAIEYAIRTEHNHYRVMAKLPDWPTWTDLDHDGFPTVEDAQAAIDELATP